MLWASGVAANGRLKNAPGGPRKDKRYLGPPPARCPRAWVTLFPLPPLDEVGQLALPHRAGRGQKPQSEAWLTPSLDPVGSVRVWRRDPGMPEPLAPAKSPGLSSYSGNTGQVT